MAFFLHVSYRVSHVSERPHPDGDGRNMAQALSCKCFCMNLKGNWFYQILLIRSNFKVLFKKLM